VWREQRAQAGKEAQVQHGAGGFEHQGEFLVCHASKLYISSVPRKKDPTLRLVAIRLHKADLAVARDVARRRARPYQHVVRDWVSDGAQANRRVR
jgi:hypothetical protein